MSFHNSAEIFPFAFFAAMKEEFASCYDKFQEIEKVESGGVWLSLRSIGKEINAIFGITKIGAERAKAQIELLKNEFPAIEGIILVGCAGSLSVDFGLFDCLYATHILTQTDETKGGLSTIQTNPSVTNLLAQTIPIGKPAKFLTVGDVIKGIVEKRRLHEETGADAVEMEGAIIARMAKDAGLSFAMIRWILDTANERITPPDEPLTSPEQTPYSILAARAKTLSDSIADWLQQFIA